MIDFIENLPESIKQLLELSKFNKFKIVSLIYIIVVFLYTNNKHFHNEIFLDVL